MVIKTQRIKSISEFHKLRGLPQPEHPLISIVDFSKIKRTSDFGQTNWVLDFYQISLKRGLGGRIRYGQQEYDFDNGMMFFISPQQVFRIEPDANPSTKREGWMLLIHPDFFRHTSLANTINKYEFFDYTVSEALFLSEKEEKTMNSIIENIRNEYHANIDSYSQKIITSQIETLLNYSDRFYNRQFITRKITNHKILTKVEKLLSEYFNPDSVSESILPTVQLLADSLHVSPKYLSKLLRNLTGQGAQEHIHNKLIEKAKERLSTTSLSVSEIAFSLGFEHSQSFSKFFKNKTAQSPLKFRKNFIN